MANTQQITVSNLENLKIKSDGTLEVQVLYNVLLDNPADNPNVNFLALNLHFNGEVLDLLPISQENISNINDTLQLPRTFPAEDRADEDNVDIDDRTNRMFSANWSTGGGQTWPGNENLPLTLYTAEFQVKEGVDYLAEGFSTPINFFGTGVGDFALSLPRLELTVNQVPTIADDPVNDPLTIAENSDNNTPVGGTFSITDADDALDTLEVTDDSAAFDVVFDEVENQYRIIVVDSSLLDFETNPTFTFNVTATDPLGESSTQAVTVNLTNVNEAPVITATGLTIAENSANDTVVGGTFSVLDPEGDTPLTFTDTSDAFDVQLIDGEYKLVVVDSSLLDLDPETDTPLTFSITATDPDGASSTQEVTVTVTNDPSDDNTAPTFNGATFSILENLPNDTVVGTLDVTDLEDAIGDLSFEIDINGNTDIDGDGNSPFKVAFNGTNWEILVNDSGDLNYEQIKNFNLTVKATDTFGASTEANILINLEDVEIELIDNTNVIDIVEQNLRVGAGQTLTLNIQNVTSNAVFNNSLTFYRIDSADGGIDADGNGTIDFMPGDAGYLAQALSRIENPDNLIKGQGEGTTGTGAGNFVFTNTSDNTVYYAPILLANAGGLENLNDFLELNAANEIDDQSDIAAYFIFEEANAKYEGVISDSRFAWDGQSLRVEDLHSGFSDNDFNDLVFDSNL